METFIFNDGGRKEAGYKGFTRDCVTRAIAIVTGKPYKEVYDALNEISKKKGLWHSYHLEKNKYGNSYVKASSARTGVHKSVYGPYIESLGYEWIPTMGIGTGCQVHLDPNELPKGRLIVILSRHLTAVIDGVIHDTYDCSRDNNRCVYGYYIKKEVEKKIYTKKAKESK